MTANKPSSWLGLCHSSEWIFTPSARPALRTAFNLRGLLRFCRERHREQAECEREDEPNGSQDSRLLGPIDTRTAPPAIWVPSEGARGLSTDPIQEQHVGNVAPVLGLGGLRGHVTG